MSQPTATIVIPVWNQWQFTKACLETLRPTLGVRDNVVVVDNGSQDGTATGLKQFSWVTVITNKTNLGFAKACNQGAAAATGDVVVFLNNDTLLPARWLDGLMEPFADTTVAATGPRSNFVSGPQLVEDIGYATGSMAELRRFAKQWRQDHRSQVSETQRLVGFCLAVRRSEFEAIGGFDEGFGTGGCEDDDLCLRLINNGGRLLICHESFVHHHGHVTFDGNGLDWFAIQQDNMDRFRTKHASGPVRRRDNSAPLLSACMIVKDEEALLPACLASLNGVVDEVVIYDTGSTDRSIEIARAAGAKVIEGHWDDDFSRARNASLANCTGEWIMHIDADEIFEGDAQGFRDALLNSPLSAHQMEIVNLSPGGRNNLTHRPCRVFKRMLYNWTGRLHEQVVMRSGNLHPDFGFVSAAHLVHSGYLPEAMEAKKKGERNIRLAQADADDNDDGRDMVDKLTNLGRSHVLAGHMEEALSLFTQARAMHTDFPVIRRTLLRSGVQAALTVGRPEEALSWAEDLDAVTQNKDPVKYFRGLALVDLHRWEEALAEFNGLKSMKDDDGVVFSMNIVHHRRGLAFAKLGQWEQAADALTPLAKAEWHEESIWALVVESYWQAGRNIDQLLRTIPQQHLNAVFSQLLYAPAQAADVALESLYSDPERQRNVLALAIRIAPNLPLERALIWSDRLRKVGLEEHCPLVTKAWNAAVPAAERTLAAAVALESFNDERAKGGLRFAAAALDMEQFHPVLLQLNDLSPDLLEPFILAAASNAPRSLAMAQVLNQLGAADEAVAVLLHGVESDLRLTSDVAGEAAQWLESLGRTTEAASVRKVGAGR